MSACAPHRPLRWRLTALALIQLLVAALATLAAAQPTTSTARAFNAGFDHRAHAVSGGPYSVLDAFDVGFAVVHLSGTNSHTHFFNPTTGEVGRITRYEWKMDKRVICSTVKCNVRFVRGTHRVTLTVWDSTGDFSRASTNVYVLAPTRPGVTMLYYPNRELFPAGKKAGGQATYSVVSKKIGMFVTTDFPAAMRTERFSMRVLSAIEFPRAGVYQLRLRCGGADCNLFVGGRPLAVARNRNNNLNAVTLPMYSRIGRKSIEIVYVRRSADWAAPSLVLWWRTPRSTKWEVIPAAMLTRNPAVYQPVIHRSEPPNGAVGSVITLIGSSFIEVARVEIGSSECVAVEVSSEFRLRCVVPGGSGRTTIRVVTALGKVSNTIDFIIVRRGAPKGAFTLLRKDNFLTGDNSSGRSINKRGRPDAGFGPVGYYQKIQFRKAKLKWPSGQIFKAKQMTTIALGPDMRYYIGSLNGFIHVLDVDRNYIVQSYCRSANIGYTRSILGLAFNPADFPTVKLYASASVLDWNKKKLISYDKGWRNGQIVVFRLRNAGRYCMVKTETVITGLPVSNHDHGVNSLTFNSWGALLISTGGTTNAGVSKPNDFLGGVPDSPLSGAVLIAQVMRKGFNGNIKYMNPGNPAIAVKISGDVEVFAPGLRNSFGLLAHSNGNIYATDNGSNKGYGYRSFKCSTGPDSEGPALQEPDSLKIVTKGVYLGYSNRNRGRYDSRQCRHWGPTMNGQKNSGWSKPLTILDASTNGLIEYTCNAFGAQMRGDLLATKFSITAEGLTYRIQLGQNGFVKSKSPLIEYSGLTGALSADGGMLMPRVYQSTIATLRPTEANPGILVVTSVTPSRGPRSGGVRVTIYGWNLRPPLIARFGEKRCTHQKSFAKNGRSFTCIAPPGSGKVPVVVTRENGEQSRTYGWEYWYMEV